MRFDRLEKKNSLEKIKSEKKDLKKKSIQKQNRFVAQ